MSALLTTAEVAELTGYEKPSFQAAWLRKEGIRHFINSKGWVIVPCDALTGNQLGGEEPDFTQFDAQAQSK